MAQQIEAVDLTQTDGESEDEKFSVPCGSPHHAILLKAMRKQLHDKQQEIAELENRINTRDVTIADRQARIADLQIRDATRVAEIRRLEAQVTALQDRLDGRGKRHKRTWPNKLKAAIVDGNRQLTYEMIHDLCCKEENMSTSTKFTHPRIRLGVSSNGWKPEDAAALPGQDNATFPSFHALPSEIQARIFRLWLHKDRPIHCFSRLDPFAAPSSWPVTESASGMYNRFYWGEERLLNLTEDTADPQVVLGLFSVCKSFYFKGMHAFYGLNTFAFSSLGEFGRFCKGIGDQRASRIQYVELTWTGSQYLTAEPTISTSKRGKTIQNWDSVRTRPLSFFLKLRRLRTISIFLDESGPLYERRSYESPETKAKLLERTANQPNFRQNRSIRTIQGLDYLYALRGLVSIRLFDLRAMLGDQSLVAAMRPIRDTSFLADLNSTVTMRKSAEEARDCDLKNLPQLFSSEEGASPDQAQLGNPMRHWLPSAVDWSTVQVFYSDSQAAEANVYRPTRTYYGVRDLHPGGDDEGPGPAHNIIPRDNNNGPRPGDEHGDNSTANAPNRNPNGGNGNSRHEGGRPSARAGPSHQQPSAPGPSRGPERPILQPRPAATLNANPRPSGLTSQKRPLQDSGATQAKRRKHDVQPLRAHPGPAHPGPANPVPAHPVPAQSGPTQQGPQTREQLVREDLGLLANCRSVSSLFTPFAENLKRRDWYLIKRVLQRSEARENRSNFHRLVLAEGKLPGNWSSAHRIIQALLN